MSRRIWIDGEFVAWKDATVHVLSHSHQRGSLIFDYMSIHQAEAGPAIFRLDAHIDRFMASCAHIGMELSWSREQLMDACVATVAENVDSSSLKISAYFPSVETDIVPQDPHVAVAVAAYDNAADVISANPGDFHFSAQLSVLIERERRNRRPDIIEPQIKIAANYASPMIAKLKARRRGFDEIILMDEDGYLTEAPTSNFFMVGTDGKLLTPPEQYILHGVTRASVLELIRAEGFEVEIRRVKPEELRAADEAFLTVTSMGVWPIVKVDGVELGRGQVGPVTSALRARFERVLSGADAQFASWLTPVS